MVRKSLNVKSAKQLNGASVCVSIGTTTELNLADYFRANNMTYKPVVYEKADEVLAAYDNGRCDVYTTDRSGLAAQRIKLKNPDEHVVLPEIISKEPLGPVVRHGDDAWFDIVKWALYAMLEAEEYGVNSENVDQMKANSKDPVVKRLLGLEGDMGKSLGVGNEWAYNIIKKVGNYGESYARNVGPSTPLKLERGANALWKDGGLQYPMPVR
jgi:general L-amino acid transport system substrate-binding protein